MTMEEAWGAGVSAADQALALPKATMVDTEATHVVRGEILIPPDVAPADAAELVVQVEDVSRADAPSLVIGEQRHQRVRLRAAVALPFEVEVPARLVHAKGSYSARVHVDMSGSGTVDVGDLISTQSYPVLTRGSGDDEVRVSIRVV